MRFSETFAAADPEKSAGPAAARQTETHLAAQTSHEIQF